MNTLTIELPDGVRHYRTTCFAESWDAYQALSQEDGWQGHRAAPKEGEDPAEVTTWKDANVGGYAVTVIRPNERPVAA